MRRHVCCIVAIVLGGFLAAQPARAVTFGANLNRPADNPYTCGQAVFPQLPPTSCSVLSVDVVTGESVIPPVGNGVITSARVKVGPVTGPMQIVVEEAVRTQNPAEPGKPGYICCKAIAAGPVFTPTANSITQIPLNLPVRQDLAPDPISGTWLDQHLSLSVLNPNVPIPAHLHGDCNSTSVGIWYPHWTVGEERFGGNAGTCGATILFNAEWQPTGGGGGGGAGGVSIDRRTVEIQRNKALLELACNQTATCDGSVALQNQQAARLLPMKAVVAKVKNYGKASFSIPAGQTKTVKTKLKPAAKRALKKKRKLKAWANITLAGSPTPIALQVTLKKKK